MNRLKIREASAGTGKTYRIQHDVADFIRMGIRPEKILVVTFTEKATAELRTKVRDTLAKAPDHPAIRVALSQFDRITVQTIHGFCNQLLGSFAFEMGVSIQPELTNDRSIRTEVLSSIVRAWPQRFGIDLSDVLSISDYPHFNRADETSTWEQTVLSVSALYGHGDIILPSSTVSLDASTIAEVRSKLASLRQSASKLIEGSLPGRTEETALRTLIAMPDDLGSLETVLTGAAKKLSKSSLKGAQILAEQAEEIARTLLNMGYYLQKQTILELIEKTNQRKAQRSLISYNDMLEKVRDSLSDSVVEQMRNRYDVAVVDEFQDTDPIQWAVFRRVFLESKDKFLYVVGDPKQAIYGFRGANVHTYYAAARDMEEKGGPDSKGSLIECRRSTPELIASLNCLFSHNKWFGDRYKNVVSMDRPSVPDPMIFVDVSGKLASVAAAKYASHVAYEIQTRVREGAYYRDFCVLVKGKADSNAIERALRRAGIPHAYYKKQGVYQSNEAFEWLLMLVACFTLRMDDIKEAMLTNFFRVQPIDLVNSDVPERVLSQFRQWNTLALEGKIARLLRSMMVDTLALLPGNAENVLAGEQLDPVDDYPRRRANLEHIARDIEILCRGTTLSEALATLRARINDQTTADEESDLHHEESDLDRVRIMTIHASKGLDFDCVFIAGGFGEFNGQAYLDYFDPGGSGARIFDLAASTRDVFKIQRFEEYKRLYYVAFTRARDRVFAPFFPSGRGGPLSHLVAPAADQVLAQNLARLVQPMHAGPPEPLTRTAKAPGRTELSRFPTNLSVRAAGLTSYSGILRRAVALDALRAEFGDTNPAEDEPLPLPETRDPTLDQKGNFLIVDHPELPRGEATGNAIHEALEGLDFSEFDRKQVPKPGTLEPATRDHIQACLNEYGLVGEDMFRAALAMIHSALNADLKGIGRLCKVKHKVPEFRFLARAQGFSGDKNLLVRDGYIHGAIDLVFRVKDTYYILDWKTNTLPDYSESSLQTSIAEERYDLQYSIYGHALISWLNSSGKFEPSRFGGVFYLYLRGMKPGETDGVYFVRPDPAALEDLAGIIRRFSAGEPLV